MNLIAGNSVFEGVDEGRIVPQLTVILPHFLFRVLRSLRFDSSKTLYPPCASLVLILRLSGPDPGRHKFGVTGIILNVEDQTLFSESLRHRKRCRSIPLVPCRHPTTRKKNLKFYREAEPSRHLPTNLLSPIRSIFIALQSVSQSENNDDEFSRMFNGTRVMVLRLVSARIPKFLIKEFCVLLHEMVSPIRYKFSVNEFLASC
ncbi:hypothetical protein QQ045_001310 [Rhodiola kirilowii]